jgi:hypothetical protein
MPLWTIDDRDIKVIVPPKLEADLEDCHLNPNQIAFLYCYITTCGHVARAAEAARISRITHYYWLKNCPNYAVAWERVKSLAAQALLDAAIERASHGVEEPVFYKGEVCGSIHKYSDTLLALLLKGEFPDKYKDRAEVKTGNIDGEVLRIDPGREVLSDQKLAALLDLGQKLLGEAKEAKDAARQAEAEAKPNPNK